MEAASGQICQHREKENAAGGYTTILEMLRWLMWKKRARSTDFSTLAKKHLASQTAGISVI